jgi:hypothetical protein
MSHAYAVRLTADDPRAPQPARVCTLLKACQLAALRKADAMERGCVDYEMSYGRTADEGCSVASNVGIMAEPRGHGNTMVMLALVAAQVAPVPHQVDVRLGVGSTAPYGGYLQATLPCSRVEGVIDVDTTLVVVPNSAAFQTWRNAIATHTTLRAMLVERASQCTEWPMDELPAFLGQYDLVLVTERVLNQMPEHYQRQRIETSLAFARLVVDEAHRCMARVPAELGFRFLWLISHLPEQLYRASASGIASTARQCLKPEALPFLCVRSTPAFLLASFDMQAPINFTFICTDFENTLWSGDVERCRRDGDIAGAVRALGGSAVTHAKAVARVADQMRAAEAAAANVEWLPRMRAVNAAALQRAGEDPAGKTCAVCIEACGEQSVMLPCAHLYCGGCALAWTKVQVLSMGGETLRCPECRASFAASAMMAIVPDNWSPRPAHPASPSLEQMMAEQLRHSKAEVLQAIAARYDTSRLMVIAQRSKHRGAAIDALRDAGIPCVLAFGNSSRCIDYLSGGRARAVVAHPQWLKATRLDLSMVDDVVVWGSAQLTDVYERLQRVGRRSQLRVHQLMNMRELPPIVD